MTLNEQIQALVRAAAEAGLYFDDLAPHIKSAFADASGVVDPSRDSPAAYGMIQTDLSRELHGEGFWFWTNRQLSKDSAHFAAGRPTERNISRIRCNVGCDEFGNLRPAAFRGFPQSGSAADDAALSRCNGTAFVFDVKDSRFGVMLDAGWPLGKRFAPGAVSGLMAIRAVDDAAVDEYLRRIAK